MRLKSYPANIAARVSVTGLPQDAMDDLIACNTVKNPQWVEARRFSATGWVSPEIPEWLFYGSIDARDHKKLSLTRGFNTQLATPSTLAALKRVRYTDNRVSVPATFPKPLLSPSAEQRHLIEAGYAAVTGPDRRFGNCLLLASTSIGKTIMLSLLAKRLGQRTLVLCPTEMIAEAWYNDLLKLFGLTEKQIGLIKQSSFRIGDQFTIASTSTLNRRQERWPELHAAFGTTILDESQVLAAPTIWNFMVDMPSKYLLTATATASKNGRLISQVHYLFGAPIAQVKSTHKETAFSMPITKVHLVETEFQFQYQEGNLEWHELAAALTGDEDRNKLIADTVAKDWTNGRVVIVVTKTHEHVEMLVEMLKERGINVANRLTGITNSNKSYTRGLVRSVNRRSARLIIATLQAVSTGANIRALDSLHIAMPPASPHLLEQLLGRIRRKHDEDKKTTEVTWYYDVQMSYLRGLFGRVAVPIFQQMKIPGYENKASYTIH